MIFDKTGTLTYGLPTLTNQLVSSSFSQARVLQLVASLEQYSKHPLSQAVLDAARKEGLKLNEAEQVSERPGEGLRGRIDGSEVLVTSAKKLVQRMPQLQASLPPVAVGLECVVAIDGRYAATYRFRDRPRAESASFIKHLGPRHGIQRLMLVSGDRQEEVQYLARHVGISEIHAGKSPEEKLSIVREQTAKGPTIYVGDGINDAPAMVSATVGVAMDSGNDVTTQAAGAVIMDNQLGRIDELIHISARMRRVALQSAVGGMAISVIGMVAAAFGWLPPVAGALGQEIIDIVAVMNALRASIVPAELSDYSSD
jgi:P-type E1-E2 ATPase